MVVHLSLLVVATLFDAMQCCENYTLTNGRLVNHGQDTQAGDNTTLVCDEGHATYNPHLTCGEDSTWAPAPLCHKVNVRFDKTSMIKYVYPIPYDTVDSTLSFFFSTPPEQSSGVLVRLASRKLSDGSRDTITVELVGGFLATTMQLSSIGERILGFCHDDVLLNDNLQHRVILKKDVSSLSMTIDTRSIQCTYPSGSSAEFKFTNLRSILVGHLQPSWGPQYGFSGCMSALSVDGLAPLVLADLAENTDTEDQVTVQDVQFVQSCGNLFAVPTTEQTPVAPTLNTKLITDAVEERGKPSNGGDKTTLIAILVTLVILLLLGLLVGGVCKRYYNNKGTYQVDESRLEQETEQEYFI